MNKGQKYNMVDQNFCIVPITIMLLHNFNNIIYIIFGYAYSPLQRGEVPLYFSLIRFPIILVTLQRWQHRGCRVK